MGRSVALRSISINRYGLKYLFTVLIVNNAYDIWVEVVFFDWFSHFCRFLTLDRIISFFQLTISIANDFDGMFQYLDCVYMFSVHIQTLNVFDN